MSEPAAPTAEPTEASQDLSFVDSFQEFLKGAPASQPEPTPDPTPASAPEPSPATDPVEELSQAKDEIDPDLKLPIDDADEPVQPDVEGSEDNPYDKGTPQHRRFEMMRKETATLKGNLDQERQTRQQLESRVREIEAAAARAEELEKRISEYEAKIAVTNLTESAAYRETIAAPLQDIIQRSDAIAERYGIDPDALADALEIADANSRREAFKKLTSGLDVDPDDHYEMRQLASELQPLKAKRAELLSKADEALAELEAQKREAENQAALEAAKTRKEAVGKVADKVASQVPFIKTLEGLDYDKVVEDTRETDFDALNPPVKAYNHMAGLILPKAIKAISALNRQIEQLSDDLAAYKNQAPRLTSDTSGARDSAGDDEDGLVERYQKTFARR